MASRKPRSVHQRAIARVLRTGNLWWMTLLKVDLQRNKKHLQNQKKRNKKKGVRNQNPQPLKQNMAFLPKASTPFLGVTKHKKTNNQRHCAGLQEGRCQRIHDLVKIVVDAVAKIRKIIVKIPGWSVFRDSDLCSERKNHFLENTSPESVGEQPCWFLALMFVG